MKLSDQIRWLITRELAHLDEATAVATAAGVLGRLAEEYDTRCEELGDAQEDCRWEQCRWELGPASGKPKPLPAALAATLPEGG